MVKETPSHEVEDGPRALPERYGAFELEGEEIVIYDGENADAWIQSDRATPLSALDATVDG